MPKCTRPRMLTSICRWNQLGSDRLYAAKHLTRPTATVEVSTPMSSQQAFLDSQFQVANVLHCNLVTGESATAIAATDGRRFGCGVGSSSKVVVVSVDFLMPDWGVESYGLYSLRTYWSSK
jgi:hypothetical protein